jgi:hypothetical protein
MNLKQVQAQARNNTRDMNNAIQFAARSIVKRAIHEARMGKGSLRLGLMDAVAHTDQMDWIFKPATGGEYQRVWEALKAYDFESYAICVGNDTILLGAKSHMEGESLFLVWGE